MKFLLVTVFVLVTLLDLGATFNIARAKRSLLTNVFSRQQNYSSVQENAKRLHAFIKENFVRLPPLDPADFPPMHSISGPSFYEDSGTLTDFGVIDPGRGVGGSDFDGQLNAATESAPNRGGGSTSSSTIYDKNDVIVVLDSSGSIGSDEFIKAKQLLSGLISELPADISHEKTRIACISFSDLATINTEFGFLTHDSKRDILQAINGIQYQDGGSTHTTAALERAKQMFETDGREDSNKVLFVATDGHSNGGGNPAVPANAMKNKDRLGVNVFVIAVSDDVNRQEVEAIASLPYIIYVNTFTEARNIVDVVHSMNNPQQ